jgi:1,4-dihydroxy-2-naphthoate octaprenyltransferase
MFLGSKDHYALRCLKAGLTVRQTVLSSYAATLILGGLALGIMYASPRTTVLLMLGLACVVGAIAWKLSRFKMPSNQEVFKE